MRIPENASGSLREVIVYSLVTMAEFPSQPAAVSAASAGSSHFPQRPAADADPFFNGSAPFRHYSTTACAGKKGKIVLPPGNAAFTAAFRPEIVNS